MRPIRTFIIVLALAFTVGSAQAQFGDLLKKGQKAKKVSDAMTPWTAEQEKAIGDASAAKLVHVFGLYQNPAMAHYVSTVGNAVAQFGTRPMEYKFGILDSEAVTAFGVPGGYVFITRGAIANMKDEAELAGALAHEVAHIDNRHLEKQVRSKGVTGLAFEEVGDRVPAPGILKDLAKNIVTNLVTMSYSRDKEDEADRKGVEMAAGAGYDAGGLKNFLVSLKTAEEADQQGSSRRLGVWGSTHPPLSERINSLTALAAKFSGGAVIQERFAKNASFGPSEEELAKAAADKAAAEKAEADRLAAEKKAAEPAKKPVAKPSVKKAPEKK
ncbi:MAG TPA: M48 family metalloprotease [Terriglobales bacterium]|nr:M48 family metalloprotease [Terriglobales bacterium]